MKLLIPITAIIAAAAAGRIYNIAPHQESYANSAELYQSQLEYQQHGLYSDQSQAYTGHESVHQGKPSEENTAKILSYVNERDGHGYQYSYETENGIKAQEMGQGVKGIEAHGAYSYTGDDGHTYTVTYTADEHGFRPQGDHLPTPPPIPEAIAKAIEQNAKDEAAGIHDDGQYVEEHHQHHHESHGIESHGLEAHGHEAHGHEAHGHEAHGHEALGLESHGHETHGHEALSYQMPVHHAQTYHAQSYQSHIHPVEGSHQVKYHHQVPDHVYMHFAPSAFPHHGGYSVQEGSSAGLYKHKH